MSADLEREAREAAEAYRVSCGLDAVGEGQLTHEVIGYSQGFFDAATLREKEIGELRALLREACGILNDAIKTDETFWLEEMRGTNEDLTERIMLMLPPTPVPETKP